jgi:4-amino-4-deoxy-L-arabinose transferase-like glycosyltransferase
LKASSLDKSQFYFLLATVIGAFLIRMVLLPYAQVVDADAVTRVFIAKKWLSNPEFIYSGVWPPLHHYMNAFVIWVTGNHTLAPIVFNCILSSLVAIPIYFFTRREISIKGAWFAAILISISPILLRNSFHTLSGTPYVLLSTMALNLVSKFIREDKLKYAIYGGLVVTIATGFRYEAWLFFALLTAIGLYNRAWKLTFIFWMVGMIFPLFWMIGNYIDHGDIFYGLSGAYKWNIVLEGVNNNVPIELQLLRLVFFPVSWFVLLSPILSLWMIGIMIKKLKSKSIDKRKLVWTVPFLVFFTVFIWKASNGTLLLQHRFTSTLLVLSIPFTSLLIKNVDWRSYKRLFTIVVLILLLPLSNYWMTVQFEDWFIKDSLSQKAVLKFRTDSLEKMDFVPRLNDQTYAELSNEIEENKGKNNGLILDFFGWDNTYHVALNSGVDPSKMYILNGAVQSEKYIGLMERVLKKCPRGYMVLRCNSRMREMYTIDNNVFVLKSKSNLKYLLKPITSNGFVHLFQYEKISASSIRENTSKEVKLCPIENSYEALRLEIYNDDPWYRLCLRIASDKGISVDESINEMIEWMKQDRGLDF